MIKMSGPRKINDVFVTLVEDSQGIESQFNQAYSPQCHCPCGNFNKAINQTSYYLT